MKKIRILSIVMTVLLFFILCSGCGSKEQLRKEAAEKMLLPFEQENVTELHLQQKQDDLLIELNHVVFEDNMVILDYTMEAPDVSKYEDVTVKHSAKVDGCGIAVEEHPEKVRRIEYTILEDGMFSQKDVGKQTEITLASFEYGGGSGIEMVFPVMMENVFSTEKIDIGQEFCLEEGIVLVKSMEFSKFHTNVYFEDMTAESSFMTDFYNWEITDEAGKILQCLGGSDGVYYYTALPEDCSEIGLTLIKYREGKEDLSYDKVGETVKIPIRQRRLI